MRHRRLRFYRWFRLLFRRPYQPKCMVHLEWGPGDLEREMVFLQFIPTVGDDVVIETRDVANDTMRWRVDPHTVGGTVTRVEHWIHIDYGNDAGPNSLQSVTVYVNTRLPAPEPSPSR